MTSTTPHRPRIGGGVLRTGILIAATMTTGLLAGVFANWSNAIMPGLGNVDDRTFVTAFRALDEAITNPLFLGGFTVALLLIALSVALHLRAEQRPVLRWVGAALVSYLVVFVITVGVHEPLNEQFRAAGEADGSADFAAVRVQLDEARWAAWNTVRAVASTIAFGCLAWALVIHREARGLTDSGGSVTVADPPTGRVADGGHDV